MSFRTRRVLFMAPFYMLFPVFSVEIYLFIVWWMLVMLYCNFIDSIIGLIHLIPMLFEAKKSTKLQGFLSTLMEFGCGLQ